MTTDGRPEIGDSILVDLGISGKLVGDIYDYEDRLFDADRSLVGFESGRVEIVTGYQILDIFPIKS
jgi:hypothetical protein